MTGEQIDSREIVVKKIFSLDGYDSKYWSDLISLSHILFKKNKAVLDKIQVEIDALLELCYDGTVDPLGKPVYPDFFSIQKMIQKRNPNSFVKIKKRNEWGYRRVKAQEVVNRLEGLKWLIFDEIGNLNIRFRDSTLNVIR